MLIYLPVDVGTDTVSSSCAKAGTALAPINATISIGGHCKQQEHASLTRYPLSLSNLQVGCY
jgi:hypothetical protein